MAVYHEVFQIQSDTRPTMHDVTAKVIDAVKKSEIQNGLVTVFSQHTTCSVFIQEESHDKDYYGTDFLNQDLINGLTKIFPSCLTEGQYAHPGPKHIEVAHSIGEEACWSLNTDAHLRSVMLGRSVNIPVIDGRVELGEFGRVFFADFDQVRARQRKVRITIMG